MLKILLIISVISFLISACTVTPLPPVKVDTSPEKIDYLQTIKPILDNRCVSCHSCYNAPCQLKLSSFEGLERGASQERVYNGQRIQPIHPTRLFMDAEDTSEWRDRGFFSVTANEAANDLNDSIMLHLLDHKMKHPVRREADYPDTDNPTCASDTKELSKFLHRNPDYGMPYGFPALEKDEYQSIARWLQQGANGPSLSQQKRLQTPGVNAAIEIQKWEAFFNMPDAKHALTARYLYEHMFLAHLNFTTEPIEFYELVRSTTAPGQPIKVIATVLPFDDPGSEPFYYRLRRIHSTIVHKTHMVFTLDDAKLARFNELFIQPEWIEKPHRVGYDPVISANPFVAFGQIPPKSRYQFLLDNSLFMIMTFIRGPVCKGQVALNVINDHFWVMFMDPEHDLAVQRPLFITREADNLSMPIESAGEIPFWRSFSDYYKERAENFYTARQNLYADVYREGLGLEAIWKGEQAEDAPLLTIYRHFDSASVHKGVLGDLPRTLWVIDYPLFERIYYALVAGFDVFGNIGHQTNIRRYMDNLRIEGESYFTNLLPQQLRHELFASWYIGSSTGTNTTYQLAPMPAKIAFGPDPKRELIEKVVNAHILPETGIQFDPINYLSDEEILPELPISYTSTEDYIQAFKAISLPGTAFVREISDFNANLAYLRIKIPQAQDKVISIVVNRWHDNVDFLFLEQTRLDSTRDTADFIPGFVGSYPNYFFEVEVEELSQFFMLLKNYQGTVQDREKLSRYGVGRHEARFWKSYDWFLHRFKQEQPINSGLFDLNRYYNTSRE